MVYLNQEINLYSLLYYQKGVLFRFLVRKIHKYKWSYFKGGFFMNFTTWIVIGVAIIVPVIMYNLNNKK